MIEDDFNFSARLLKDKASKKVLFKEGQVVTVKRNSNGTVYIMGHPSITLGDRDYEMYLPEATLWKLLLQ